MNQLNTILFDLGNVIVKVMIEKLEEGFKPYCKINSDKIIKGLVFSSEFVKYQEGKLNSSQFFNKSKRYFKMDIKFGDFYNICNVMFTLIEGPDKIIRTIRKKYPDIKLLLFSDTNESHFEFCVKKYNVLDLFDKYVLSYKVGKHKPHKKMFQAVLKEAGSTPKTTFYTDDRADLIKKARVLGIRAFQFTSPEVLREQLAKFNCFV